MRELVNGVIIFSVYDDNGIEVLVVARCLGCDDYEEYYARSTFTPPRRRRACTWAHSHRCSLGSWYRVRAASCAPDPEVNPVSQLTATQDPL